MSGCFYSKNRQLLTSNVLLGLLVGYFSIFSFIHIFSHHEMDDDDDDWRDCAVDLEQCDRDFSDDERSCSHYEIEVNIEPATPIHAAPTPPTTIIVDPLSRERELLPLPGSQPGSKHSTLSSIGKHSAISSVGKHSTFGKHSTLFSTLGRQAYHRHQQQHEQQQQLRHHKRKVRKYADDDLDTKSENDFFYEHYYRVRYRPCLLYGLFYVENFTMLLLWYLLTPDQGTWFHHWGLVAGLVAMPLHALFQRLYR
jgi:hypothetical protein